MNVAFYGIYAAESHSHGIGRDLSGTLGISPAPDSLNSHSNIRILEAGGHRDMGPAGQQNTWSLVPG